MTTITPNTFTEQAQQASMAPRTGSPCSLVAFLVTLRDGSEERVEGADAYQQEQSMTTFFRTEGRQTVDCWSVRMASFRTDHILAVRRVDAPGVPVAA